MPTWLESPCETFTFKLAGVPDWNMIFENSESVLLPKEDDYHPAKIIKSGLATVVIWPDSTKTVVKCAKDETYSLYNAVASAIAIKIFGSNSAFKRMIEQTVTVQKPKKEKKHGRIVRKVEREGFDGRSAE